jgi:ubiquinone biosynthesis monooxygenase Coq7
MGEKAAMACTVAVEEVIDEHYAAQVEKLESMGKDEKDLKDTCKKFRLDELEHRDTGLEYGAEQAPGYEALSALVKTGSRMAIWLSERV